MSSNRNARGERNISLANIYALADAHGVKAAALLD